MQRAVHDGGRQHADGVSGRHLVGPDFEAARRYVLDRLLNELSPALTYHSVAHTRDGVVPAAERLAQSYVLSAEEIMLLRTAAWFHDVGFVEQRVGHEAAGVRIAATVLPGFGYTHAQVAAIGGMIMATRLPQLPQTLLEQIVADADLDSLGRDDFDETNQLLRSELEHFGSPIGDAEWLTAQSAFLAEHHYWTVAAQRSRDAGKAQNLDRMRRALERLGGSIR